MTDRKFKRPLNVLVLCEESQRVTMAFREKGHNAYSCDLLPASGGFPEYHLQVDMWKAIEHFTRTYGPIDIVIAHPPCTYLTNAGNRWLVGKDAREGRWELMVESAQQFKAILEIGVPYIAVENPIMHKHGRVIIGKKYTQIIHPYQFGHMRQKSTCLWLQGLDPLVPTDNVKEEMLKLPKSERSEVHYMSPGPERSKLRSKTYQGIANAFADQWSHQVLTELDLYL